MNIIDSLDGEAIEKLGEINYVYSYEHIFEKLLIGYEHLFVQWCQNNLHIIALCCVVYLIVIFSIKRYMKQRPRFDLQLPLVLWSGSLAIFSIMGAIRTIPLIFYVLTNHGFYHATCHPFNFYGVMGFWTILFVVSKLIELGDTIFIVLRKQHLIFLHWYHHITVLFFVFLSYGGHLSAASWFVVMNYIVHAFMYTYYTMRAMKMQIPGYFALIITTMQIAQMIMGLFVIIYTYVLRSSEGSYCKASDAELGFGFFMYLSYFVLFAIFFYNNYISKKSPKQLNTKSN